VTTTTPTLTVSVSIPAAPCIRWAGGKRALLAKILPARPASVGRYLEPFVGAGAVVLALPHPAERCLIADANREVVALHRSLATQPEAVISRLRDLDADRSVAAFRALRAQDPDTLSDPDRAARLVTLQTLNFNGLYRVNQQGVYNSSYGFADGKAPSVCREAVLRRAAARLRGVSVVHADFASALGAARAGDWVYLDPPYCPTTPTASFDKYTPGGFGEHEHRRLAATISDLVDRGVQVMLSNSDTPTTRRLYADCGLTHYRVQVRRSVSCNAAARGHAPEVLGLSYDLDRCADPATAARALLGAESLPSAA